MVTATTPAGQLAGTDVDGVAVFRGVPYAAPPIGPLRFRAPAEVPAWSGIRDATTFGNVALQEPSPLEELNGTHRHVQDEDCLTLNIWTPACDDARRPVLVWIHGGSYLSGSGTNPAFDGTSFAAMHGLVVVTINYRLNVFGYLHLEGLSADEEGSGSCGLLDQIAALRWVRESITSFGGDPANVTVAGESAGAMSVGCLLGTPAAAGLFHRAVLQSGAPATQGVAGAEDVTLGLLTELGIPADANAPEVLRAIPAEALLAASSAASAKRLAEHGEAAGFSFAPVVGTSVVPQDPFVAVAQGSVRDVPLLIGTDLDEMQVLEIVEPGSFDFDDAGCQARFSGMFGEHADRALSLYAEDAMGSGRHIWGSALGDRIFLLPALALTEAQLAASGQVWTYLFAWRTTAYEGRLGAFHTLEIPFVFNTLDLGSGPVITDGPPERARLLSATMHATWARFAATGDPGWVGADLVDRPTMVFADESAVVNDPLFERRALWADVLS